MCKLFFIKFIFKQKFNSIEQYQMEIELFRIWFRLILISLLVFKTVSIVDIKEYSVLQQQLNSQHIGQTMGLSQLNNNTQTMVMVSKLFHLYIYDISLSNQAASLGTQYQANIGKIDKIFFFQTYILCYSFNSTNINVFGGVNNYGYNSSITINQYVFQFYHALSKSIVVFLTTTGKLGYIPDSSLISSPQVFLIDYSCLLGTTTVNFTVSLDQNLVAITGVVNSASLVAIFSLINYDCVCHYNLGANEIGSLDWTSDNQTLLIAYSTSGILTKLNVINCSGVQYSITSALSYEVIKITYYALTNEAIFTGLSISTPYNYAIYAYSFDTNSISFLRGYSGIAPVVSSNYQGDNKSFFSISQTNLIKTLQIITNCANGSIYDLSTYTCVSQAVKAVSTESQNFQRFIEITLDNQVITKGNLVPGSRKILQPLFIFFINIDDLWLYNYHEREYDSTVTFVYNSVQQLQNKKWSLFQFKKIWSIIDLNSNTTISQFSYKYKYSSRKFIQVEQNSNGFILNSLNFFCSNVLLMFIMFIVFRILFFLLFNYRISILFRQYSFWLYFLMMTLEGNVQYLTYLFTFEMKNFFSDNFINKIGLGISVLLYFTIFISAVAAFPIIKHQYGKLICYFTQNLRVCTVSFVYLTIQTGYRNILLGFLHLMFEQNYELKIGSLMLAQTVFLIFSLILIAKARIFMNHLKVWLNIIATLLRILIIFTFFFDKDNIDTEIQYAHIAIFYIYFSQMYVAVFIQMIKIIIEAIKFLKSKSTVKQSFVYKQKTILKNAKLKVQFIKQDFLLMKENKKKQSFQQVDSDFFLKNNQLSSNQNYIQKYKQIKQTFKILNQPSSLDTNQKGKSKIKIKKFKNKTQNKNMQICHLTPTSTIISNTNIFEIKIE